MAETRKGHWDLVIGHSWMRDEPQHDLELHGKSVTVVGLARSGIAACKVLAERGARVLATDRLPRERLRGDLAGLEDRGVRIEAGAHRREDFLEADLIVVSPGVPTELELLSLARSAGVPIWGEVELASRLTPARFLGITGTNGKSTTTSLLGAMLEAAGLLTVVAGQHRHGALRGGDAAHGGPLGGGGAVQLPAGDDRDLPPARGGPPQPGAGSPGSVPGPRQLLRGQGPDLP